MLLRLALVLTFAACASAPRQGPQDPNAPAQKTAAKSDPTVQCHEVTDTGTMFSHTECTKTEDAQEQHDDAQRFMKRPRSQPMGGK
jgi:hypothetical protein